MARVEVISALTGECIGYFGDTPQEKTRCSSVLSKVDITKVVENGDTKLVYVSANVLPE